METKFKNVAHLYLGCELTGMSKHNNRLNTRRLGEILLDERDNMPILFPLSAMTDGQKQKYRELSVECKQYNGINLLPNISAGRLTIHYMNSADPYLVTWLLSQHFDLFNLIPSGEAIDATTI